MSDTETLEQLRAILGVESNEQLVSQFTDIVNQVVLVAVKDENIVVAPMNVGLAQQIIATLNRGISNAILKFQ